MEFEKLCHLIHEAVTAPVDDNVVLSEAGKQKIDRLAKAVSALLDPETTGGEIVKIYGRPQIDCAYIETEFDCLDIAEKEMDALRDILAEVGGLSMGVNVKKDRVNVVLGLGGVYERL